MDTANTRSVDTSCQIQPPLKALPGSHLRRAIVLILASIASVVSPIAFTTAYAAEECYKDTAGRIVSRRRPGFVEVACPWRPFSFVSTGASTVPQPEDVDTKTDDKVTATPVSSHALKPASLPRRT